MKLMASATFAACLAAVSLAPGCAPARLSAADVVARNVAARGGLEGWRKVETMAWSGHIESAHAPAPRMPFELEQKRPNKTRLLINALGDKTVRVFDGQQGWKLRQTGGRPAAEPYSPQELSYARAGSGIDGPLIDLAAKGSSVSLEGIDEIGGRKAYHLTVRPAKGDKEEVWVDAETFLDLRCDRMTDGPAGSPRRVSVSYGDYRSVEGLKIPFLITTGGGPGAAPDKMQIERVVLNAPLDDSTFVNPAGPRQRNRGRLGAEARASAQIAPWTAPTSAGEGRDSVTQ
jgi:outer membrane lipoprotein-sorting protein